MQIIGAQFVISALMGEKGGGFVSVFKIEQSEGSIRIPLMSCMQKRWRAVFLWKMVVRSLVIAQSYQQQE